MKKPFNVVKRRAGSYNLYENCTFILNEVNNNYNENKKKSKIKNKNTFLQKLLKFKSKLVFVFLIVKNLFFIASDL